METQSKRPRVRKIGYVFVIMPHHMNLQFDQIESTTGYHPESNVQITHGTKHHESVERTYTPQITTDHKVAPCNKVIAIEISSEYRDVQRHNNVVKTVALRARRQSELCSTVVIMNCGKSPIVQELKSWRAEIRDRFQIQR